MANNDPGTFAVSVTTQQNVSPRMSNGGHLKVTTPASGSGFALAAGMQCSRVVVVNIAGDTIEVQQDGAGEILPIPDEQAQEFYGITNTSQLGFRKKTAGAVDVYLRWEV